MVQVVVLQDRLMLVLGSHYLILTLLAFSNLLNTLQEKILLLEIYLKMNTVHLSLFLETGLKLRDLRGTNLIQLHMNMQ